MRQHSALLLCSAMAIVLCAVPAPARTGPEVPPSVRHRLSEAETKRAQLEKVLTRTGDLGAAKSWAPDPAPSVIDVLHYDLDLHLDFDRKVAAGTISVLIEAVAEGLQTVELDADQGLRILGAVLTQDEAFPLDSSRSLAFSHAVDRLVISLHRTLEAGERIRLLIPYGGHADRGGDGILWHNHSGAPIAWTMAEPFGARVWWPCNDRPDDKATFELSVTAPDHLVVAANGLESGRVVHADGTATSSWSSIYEVATYLVVMNVSNFVYSKLDYVAQDGSTMPVVVYAYPEIASAAEADLSITPTLIETLAESFGEYPFVEEKYGNVTTPLGGGMEHQTLTTFSANVIGDSWSEWLNVHELGHQWWGDWVTCDDWRELWLNEGFATYSEFIWAEHYGPDTLDRYAADADYMGYFTGALYDNPVPFSTTIYNKGGLTLRMLRHVLGDEDFFAGMLAYREAFAEGTATSEGMRDVFEQVSGTDLQWFWEQWVYGANRPRYQYSWSEPMASTLRLAVDQEHRNAALFRMPMNVVVSGAGWTETHRVWLEAQPSQTVDLQVQGSPTSVVMNPRGMVLCELSPSSEPDLDLGPDFPGPFDVGTVVMGSSTSISIPMTNVGGSDLIIDSAYSYFDNGFSVTSPSSFPVTIAPGTTTDLVVELKPNQPSRLADYIIAISNDPSREDGVSFIQVQGAGGMTSDPWLGAPQSVHLGRVPVGGVDDGRLTISNLGASDLLLSAEVDGDTFAMASVLPSSIAPGSSSPVYVRFTPDSVGDHAGSLVLSTNSPERPTFTISLTGEGTASGRLAVDPPLLNLGLSDQAPSATLKMTNTGTAFLSLTSIATDEGFTMTSAAAIPLTLQPGESHQVEVTAVEASGATDGYLTILSNDPGLPSARIPIKAYSSASEVLGSAFPAVASTPGIGGAHWISNATFLNTSDADAAVDLRFLPASPVPSETPDLRVTIPARNQRTLHDVVAGAGHSGTGGLGLVETGEGLTSVSRTYSVEDRGSFGQFIPAVDEASVLSAGHSYVLPGLASGGFHTNFGMLNLGSSALDVAFTLFDGGGDEVGSFTLRAPGGAFAQNTDGYGDFTTATISGGYAVVASTGVDGTFAVYASVVDSSSHDPTYVQPVQIADEGATEVILPVLASQPGDNQTMWRSDLTVNSTSGEPWTATGTVHLADGGSVQVGLTSSASIYIDDFLESLGVQGTGWLELSSDEVLYLASRSFNDDSAGTYGQAVPVITSADLIGADEVVVLPGLRSDNGFRTNIGFTSTATIDTTATVAVTAADGEAIGEILVDLPAGEFVQIFKALAIHLDFEGEAWAEVSSSSADARFYVHASVVDGGTGDPYLVTPK